MLEEGVGGGVGPNHRYFGHILGLELCELRLQTKEARVRDKLSRVRQRFDSREAVLAFSLQKQEAAGRSHLRSRAEGAPGRMPHLIDTISGG